MIFQCHFVSCSANNIIMNHLLLNAFYNTVTTSVGPILMWVFTILFTIETIYVMSKYLGSEDRKKK